MCQPYVILTESSCDLTPELVEQAGVEVLPLSFTIDGKNYPHYPDGREYPLDQFYNRMKEGAVAVTAAANVAELSDGMKHTCVRGRTCSSSVFLRPFQHSGCLCHCGGGTSGEVSRSEDLYGGYTGGFRRAGTVGAAGRQKAAYGCHD